MTRTEPIIAVKSVSKSSLFYQKLLGCTSQHGGETFEILTDNGTVILCLHKWGEHDHPTMQDQKHAGNGFILFFRVDNLQQIFENATLLNAFIEKDIHYNENSLKDQFILRDPDNYYLIVSN
ncbi:MULTISPECIES: glyoxalase [Sphingobacterium]|jgi:catechol-2,3-dioxygenase|uniref:Glyoxalase n=2 Tax=Sphingobacterium TaxID=28453 RepID=A0ACD5C9H6_9SPHI|nr:MULTISPECIES: glyoxalase [Sphingobacterium]HAE67261.1 glyoxalase [Sphingobacterium sp.]OFV17076.1 glyoxalase [Sphingobacterium sp. HMSC13C05]QQT45809.1 glyoxalase [Sphingobacterium multivorum]QQT61548.1 glyoxalase [Sphingobacterium multivorum]QRQ63437.1 glyoxalase [Sphingobacterium multivorum]